MLAGDAAAQSSDPFRSNPAPAAAPRPAPRHIPRSSPEPDIAPPAPVVVAPPAPDPAKRFEGIWVGRYSCDATPRRAAFYRGVNAQVKGYQFATMDAGPAGVPGYWSVTGTLTPDGEISLSIEGISLGVPGSPYGHGDHFTRRLRGRITGDSLQAADVDSGERGCGLAMTRQH